MKYIKKGQKLNFFRSLSLPPRLPTSQIEYPLFSIGLNSDSRCRTFLFFLYFNLKHCLIRIVTSFRNSDSLFSIFKSLYKQELFLKSLFFNNLENGYKQIEHNQKFYGLIPLDCLLNIV